MLGKAFCLTPGMEETQIPQNDIEWKEKENLGIWLYSRKVTDLYVFAEYSVKLWKKTVRIVFAYRNLYIHGILNKEDFN